MIWGSLVFTNSTLFLTASLNSVSFHIEDSVTICAYEDRGKNLGCLRMNR